MTTPAESDRAADLTLDERHDRIEDALSLRRRHPDPWSGLAVHCGLHLLDLVLDLLFDIVAHDIRKARQFTDQYVRVDTRG